MKTLLQEQENESNSIQKIFNSRNSFLAVNSFKISGYVWTY
jgi:hypothetical protein